MLAALAAALWVRGRGSWREAGPCGTLARAGAARGAQAAACVTLATGDTAGKVAAADATPRRMIDCSRGLPIGAAADPAGVAVTA